MSERGYHIKQYNAIDNKFIKYEGEDGNAKATLAREGVETLPLLEEAWKGEGE